MKRQNILPEGYTELPYLEIKRKVSKWFLVNNFDSIEKALKRGQELSLIKKDGIGSIHIQTNNYKYALPISEELLPYLSEEEKKSTVLMPIKTQIRPYIPHLYRFLEKQYVDEFFDTGKLKLTTIKNCETHENPSKRDTEEGSATIITNLPNNVRCESKIGIGINSFLLCTTMNYDENLYKQLKYDACFEITNPLEFSKEITNFLQRVLNFSFGPCMYLNKRELDNTKYVTIEDYNKIGFDNKTNTLNFEAIIEMGLKGIEHELMFLKHKDHYFSQKEYRLVWEVEDKNYIKDGFVYVPNAIKYCKRIR